MEQIGPYLAEKGVKAIFNVCTDTIIRRQPTIAQTLHFGTAYYGIRRFAKDIISFIEDIKIMKEYTDILNEVSDQDIYCLNNRVKFYFNKQLDQIISQGIMRKYWIAKLEKEAGLNFDSVYMNVDDIKSLIGMGHKIGLHTKSHVAINDKKFDDYIFRTEIVEAKKELEDNFDIVVDLFAYPFGSKDESFVNTDNIGKLTAEGISYIFTCYFDGNIEINNAKIGRYLSQSQDTVQDLINNVWSYEIGNNYK